jgi:hypothetical protein
MTKDPDQVAERLLFLADASYQEISAVCADLSPTHCAAMIFECCRVLDYWHVVWAFDARAPTYLSYPDFDLIARGWNLAVNLLMPRFPKMDAIPFGASTSEGVKRTETFLHNLGRVAMLRKSADMLRYGMAVAEDHGSEIKFRMSDRAALDHFRDQVDADLTEKLFTREPRPDNLQERVQEHFVKDIDERMGRLLRPWVTDCGIMTAYDAAPEVDKHFIALVSEQALTWRSEAGIHPEVSIGGIAGAELTAIGLMLISLYLKHIRFVMLAIKKHPEINLRMSLTVWTPPNELALSISEYTQIPLSTVERALNMFTINPKQLAYFAVEPTPFVPMLIRISRLYVLMPVSSIFRNPFAGVRMMQEMQSDIALGSMRVPRESWMINDLIHLFMGTRYVRIDRAVLLQRGSQTVTDIDAAILDTLTGELALFQLKWQDFESHSLKKQRSKAKNFVDQVDSWTEKLSDWISEFGVAALAERLQISSKLPITDIRLFAIGRNASRFQSYGYAQTQTKTAVGTWPQFIRLRGEIGPASRVISGLHQKLLFERVGSVSRVPIPYRMEVKGVGIYFEDIWSSAAIGDETPET